MEVDQVWEAGQPPIRESGYLAGSGGPEDHHDRLVLLRVRAPLAQTGCPQRFESGSADHKCDPDEGACIQVQGPVVVVLESLVAHGSYFLALCHLHGPLAVRPDKHLA